jgi:hypothetical protein
MKRKKNFPVVVGLPGPGSRNSGQKALGRRRGNPNQVFRAGGDWPSPGNGLNYLIPQFADHGLGLAWTSQDNHQQKQQNGQDNYAKQVRH